MDFSSQLDLLSSRIPKQLEHIQTEEATKHSLVMPFIQLLGYNVFDPTEVVPEFTADHGTKKGEKVDYAIIQDGQPIMLFECKHAGANLSEVHASQLFRYFTVTDVRIGVLTNGVEYRFFTDLEKPNKMDERPFLTVDMLNVKPDLVDELKKLSSDKFDVDELLSAAHDLKYTKALRQYLTEQWASPDEEFVRFLTKKVYDGVFTQSVKSQFTDIVSRSLTSFLNDRINKRLRSALDSEDVSIPAEREQPTEAVQLDPVDDSGIETTEEEMEGFRIVRAICCSVVEVSRIAHRDVKSYFGILLDDNNRKPICRLHFNSSNKYIGLFDGEKEDRVSIESLDDIYNVSERILMTVRSYVEGETV